MEKKKLNFRFTNIEMDTLDFYKQRGIPYAETIRRALEAYYQANGRNIKMADIGKIGPVDDEELTREPI